MTAEQSLRSLQKRLADAQANIEAARDLLAEARKPLEAAENEATATRARLEAARQSLTATRRGATACGVHNTSTMRVAIARIERRIDVETTHIRSVIASARQVCDIFEWAWNRCIEARQEEVRVLEAISLAIQLEPKETEVRHIGSVNALHIAERSLVRERSERNVDLALPDEDHYNPQYDEAELWERRNRPWL